MLLESRDGLGNRLEPRGRWRFERRRPPDSPLPVAGVQGFPDFYSVLAVTVAQIGQLHFVKFCPLCRCGHFGVCLR
jgi:hypothetical protein